MFRMKCLVRDHQKGLELLSTILRKADVTDAERIRAVVNDLISDYESNVSSSGQLYAAQHASSHFSVLLKQNESWNGIAQWLYLRQIDLDDDAAVQRLGKSLESLRDKLADRDRFILHVCTDEEYLQEMERQLKLFVETFSCSTGVQRTETDEWEAQVPELPGHIELFTLPSSVSYSALVCRAAEPMSVLQTHQTVLAHIITTEHLWEQVRGIGGAYGVSAHIDMLERLCVFSSYRDPRIEGTLQDFVSVLKRIVREGVSQKSVDSAIVSIISRELRPLYPKNASIIAFRRALYGISDTFRAERRSWTLETTSEDIRHAAQSILDSIEAGSAMAVVTGSELLEREAQLSERLRTSPITLPL